VATGKQRGQGREGEGWGRGGPEQMLLGGNAMGQGRGVRDGVRDGVGVGVATWRHTSEARG
jgi:hypothetical protein